MDRVSNTCPGSIQHACDPEKLEKQPLGLCVFSDVHPLVQEPRGATFARGPEKVVGTNGGTQLWGLLRAGAGERPCARCISQLVLGWEEERKCDPDRHLPSWMPLCLPTEH